MKSMLKVLGVGVAAAVVLAVTAPVAEAQCGTGVRLFQSIGGGSTTPKLFLNPAATGPGASGVLTTAVGRMWQCNDSASGNNFDSASGAAKTMAAAGCNIPSQVCCATRDTLQGGGGWWQIAQTTLRGVNGAISGPGCNLSTCPSGDECFVVEDYDVNGPPGTNGSAYMAGWRVPETPGNSRYWDLGVFCGAQGSGTQCTAPFEEFPVPKVLSSSKSGTNRALTMDADSDPSGNVYIGVDGQGPGSSLIKSYDLMVHHGAGDPGRDRNATCGGPPCWSLITSIAYADTATLGAGVSVPCPNPSPNAFIAFGLTFHGGGGAKDVPSQRVGRAIQIECNPNIADPPKPRPTIRMDGRQEPSRTPERSRGGR